MSGHNKWSKIKHKKAASDAKKSKVFGMLARQIAITVKEAGGDPNHSTVRAIIEKARKENMPKENIDRAVAKGSGAGESYEAVQFEGFGPGGVAMIIEGITDNNNRTASEIKHIFSKLGCTLGAPGTAVWAFERIEENGERVWKAKQSMDPSDEDGEKLSVLVEELEDHDDVKSVVTNAD